ncbi:MAG TPA: glycogen synthase [Steroidobacteraceae bacterium]|nr:glycogen synthase [Steroidobacteraceae bacterium]
MPEKYRICLLASEVEPLSKTGGLADVAGALTKYFHGAGHDVRLFTPLYDSIAAGALEREMVSGLESVPLRVGPHRFLFAVQRTELAGGAPVYLIDCPSLFARGAIYTSAPDEHLRFIAFTHAALLACQRLSFPPQVLHCHDWHTAFGPLLLRTRWQGEPLFAPTRSVLTIHNIGYQGIFPAEKIADVGVGDREELFYPPDLVAGHINSLREGVLHADALTTVSPTYAREICTAEYGMGLEDTLRARSDALTGILNGVDYDEWDPRRDRYLPHHYDAARLAVKRELKAMFLERLQLAPAPHVPLAGIVSRLAAQKGIELIVAALPRVLAARPLQFVALGSGEAKYEQALASLEQDFPGRVVFRSGYDDELAHWIEAASDLFLMPSRYEPCGLNQMYSLRYGTVPIVRRTGGLADSVEHYDPQSGQGTGVLFNDFDAPALEWALNRALDLYSAPEQWLRLMRNGMRQDFSWEHQGAEYVRLFAHLTGA